MSLKLWVFYGGAAPRRVVVYLRERGFPLNLVEILPATISVPGKPPGSVPLLALENGQSIHESIAIIEYFEDLAEAKGLGTMRGRTAEERVRVRDMLGLAEQVTTSIELAAVHGCVMFASEIERHQSAPSVRWLLRYCNKQLDRIAEYASSDGPFLVKLDNEPAEHSVTIADCVLFATLQYGWELFGLDFTTQHPRIKVFYDAFKTRPSAVIPDEAWPPALTTMAKKWIDSRRCEEDTWDMEEMQNACALGALYTQIEVIKRRSLNILLDLFVEAIENRPVPLALCLYILLSFSLLIFV